MVFGQIQTSTNWYFYGKSHFTKTGYERNASKYTEPNMLEALANCNERADGALARHVYIITGANQGIGREVTQFLARKGATVFMVCRNAERAEKARQEIIKAYGNERVVVLQADVSLEADVRKMWAAFRDHPLARRSGQGGPQLHGLLCNAGALLNKRTLTSEGFETTFACHLLFGTYLLGELAMPVLEQTPNSRLVVVSSGGMYNCALPSWEVLSGTHEHSERDYSGEMAYSYAKRAQVMLAEYWAASAGTTRVVTAHPGWALSEGVESAFGSKKSWLEPLRTLWQGAEGLCWLLVVDANKIVPGAFYLDREPQPKHIAGLFCTVGSATKNTPAQTEMLFENLSRWASPRAPGTEGAPLPVWRPTVERTAAKIQALLTNPSCPASSKPIDLKQFMCKWHILASIPIQASGEHLLCNGYEHYNFDEKRNLVQVRFTSTPLDSQESQVALMHGFIKDPNVNTHWTLNPKLLFYLPLNLNYVLLHVEDDMSWCLVGVPSRSYMWIMTAKRPVTKDAEPWPAGLKSSTYRFQNGCTSSIGPTNCENTSIVSKPVFLGSGVDYSKQRSVMLAPAEEDRILSKGLLKAEQLGFDISEVRLCGWRNDIP